MGKGWRDGGGEEGRGGWGRQVPRTASSPDSPSTALSRVDEAPRGPLGFPKGPVQDAGEGKEAPAWGTATSPWASPPLMEGFFPSSSLEPASGRGRQLPHASGGPQDPGRGCPLPPVGQEHLCIILLYVGRKPPASVQSQGT